MVANKKKPGPYLAFYMKMIKECGIEFSLNSVFILNCNIWASERGTLTIDVNDCRSEPLIDEELSNLIQQSSNPSCLRMHLYEVGSCMYEHSDGRGATAHENIKMTLIRTLMEPAAAAAVPVPAEGALMPRAAPIQAVGAGAFGARATILFPARSGLHCHCGCSWVQCSPQPQL
jgi:hypothetical protein